MLQLVSQMLGSPEKSVVNKPTISYTIIGFRVPGNVVSDSALWSSIKGQQRGSALSAQAVKNKIANNGV